MANELKFKLAQISRSVVVWILEQGDDDSTIQVINYRLMVIILFMLYFVQEGNLPELSTVSSCQWCDVVGVMPNSMRMGGR